MEHAPVHVVLEWRIPPGQARPITAAVQTVMLATRRERGCLGCSLSTSLSDFVTVRYEEDWDSEEHLRQQLQSERYGALAVLVESAMEAPRIEFVLPSGTRGLEFAEEVRESGALVGGATEDTGQRSVARVANSKTRTDHRRSVKTRGR